ncbi:hypothetical protein [Bradyrhizobium sp.]|uniref:hypothetical protein n=1 Tax=Bradyrhizobium sp. TaxID=376 RepID=UPI002BEAEB6B|nr:hypothetical protein [Bradyrhizobium sp.]HMM91201.1 hypothetical protein [Bradyrhizobium sp.]
MITVTPFERWQHLSAATMATTGGSSDLRDGRARRQGRSRSFSRAFAAISGGIRHFGKLSVNPLVNFNQLSRSGIGGRQEVLAMKAGGKPGFPWF